MILYNVTVKVEKSVHAEWLEWMRESHIPEVLASGYFTGARLSKLLAQNEDEGMTYSIQYVAENMKSMHMYQVHFAPIVEQKHHERFEGKYVTFRTMMEVIEDFNTPEE